MQFKDFWSRLIPLFDISFWSNIGIWNIRYILGKKHISTTLQLKSPLLKIGFQGSDLHGVSVLCNSVMKFLNEAAELKNKQCMPIFWCTGRQTFLEIYTLVMLNSLYISIVWCSWKHWWSFVIKLIFGVYSKYIEDRYLFWCQCLKV